MGRKLIKVSALLEFVLVILAYLSIRYTFKNNPSLYNQLESTDFLSVLLRLTIYIIPGILLLGSLYAVTFKTKKVLVIMSLVELLTALVSISFCEVYAEGISFVYLMITVALFYLLSATLIKED